MKKPEQVSHKLQALNFQELCFTILHCEKYINYLEYNHSEEIHQRREANEFLQSEIDITKDHIREKVNKLIVLAHYNLTTKIGKPEYSPDASEIQKEVDKMMKAKNYFK